MKIPLQYQISEYDCATFALSNALSFLYDREEIPHQIVKIIYGKTLDGYDGKIEHAGLGTSRHAIQAVTSLINKYSKTNNFDLSLDYYQKNDVTFELIKDCVSNGGIVLLRTMEVYEHYILITKIEKDNVYAFDSYYLDSLGEEDQAVVTIINDQPFQYNRLIKASRLNSTTDENYALRPIKEREIVCFYRSSGK